MVEFLPGCCVWRSVGEVMEAATDELDEDEDRFEDSKFGWTFKKRNY